LYSKSDFDASVATVLLEDDSVAASTLGALGKTKEAEITINAKSSEKTRNFFIVRLLS
jgi:hypothetical protein